MSYNKRPARIGLLHFKYEDPSVSVDTQSNTIEHTTVDDQIVVQQLGRKADQITIKGVVAEYEVRIIDNLVHQGVVTLRTERWSGDVLIKTTQSDPMRAIDDEGAWLYDVTITAMEVDEASTELRYENF